MAVLAPMLTSKKRVQNKTCHLLKLLKPIANGKPNLPKCNITLPVKKELKAPLRANITTTTKKAFILVCRAGCLCFQAAQSLIVVLAGQVITSPSTNKTLANTSTNHWEWNVLKSFATVAKPILAMFLTMALSQLACATALTRLR